MCGFVAYMINIFNPLLFDISVVLISVMGIGGGEVQETFHSSYIIFASGSNLEGPGTGGVSLEWNTNYYCIIKLFSKAIMNPDVLFKLFNELMVLINV